MITFIDHSLFILYFFSLFIIIISVYKSIKMKKIETKYMAVMIIGIMYFAFYSYESISVEENQYNQIEVSEAEGKSEKEIINKILIQEFDHYKSKRLFTKNKIFDYKINRIDGPMNDKKNYDISYSVKTINTEWIAGNGEIEGLWINNKSGFYNLIRNDNCYTLKYIGGL
ncbi:MAG: hypothetical protein LKF74_03775 [Megasphaera sp.]|nr:hypothetical protein [Megasphaera sp.]